MEANPYASDLNTGSSNIKSSQRPLKFSNIYLKTVCYLFHYYCFGLLHVAAMVSEGFMNRYFKNYDNISKSVQDIMPYHSIMK